MITNSRESYQPTSIMRWDRRKSGKNWESGRRWGRIISGKRLWRRIPQIRVIGPHSEKCCLKESEWKLFDFLTFEPHVWKHIFWFLIATILDNCDFRGGSSSAGRPSCPSSSRKCRRCPWEERNHPSTVQFLPKVQGLIAPWHACRLSWSKPFSLEVLGDIPE